ncbi:hypothetical protein KCP78_07370 [Salmonella enterica subsp. enterica]|nr:hypothetical protein KCP78_07370 [Salmonella enterica subsp. enterica]
MLDNGDGLPFSPAPRRFLSKQLWFTPARKHSMLMMSSFTFQRIFDRRHPWHNINGGNFPF